MQKHVLILGLAFCLLGPSICRAEILYDNFGPGDSYNSGVGMTIGTASNWEQGVGFTATGGNYFLDNIVAAIGHVTGVNSITVSLYDSVGGLPGSILEQSTVVGLPSFGSTAPPTTFAFSGTTVLNDGEDYFFIARNALNGSDWHAWNLNSTGDTGPRPARSNGGGWSAPVTSNGAFRVNGTLVATPEPSSFSLLGMAAVGMYFACLKRRKRNPNC